VTSSPVRTPLDVSSPRGGRGELRCPLLPFAPGYRALIESYSDVQIITKEGEIIIYAEFSRGRCRVKLNIRTRSQIVLLAPEVDDFPSQNVTRDKTRHSRLLSNAQQLRGKTYLHDSAINPWDLSPRGAYIQRADKASWHVLVVNDHGQVTGCLRYRKYDRDVAFSELGLARTAAADSCVHNRLVRHAVQAQISSALRRRLSYVELGGWAISEDLRYNGDAVRMILTVYALAQLMGGALAVTTATRRHNSASILKRMGGRPLSANGSELPPYFDPKYGCEMELLGFDSTAPNPQFRDLIDDHRAAFPTMQVVLPDTRSRMDSANYVADESDCVSSGLPAVPGQLRSCAYVN